MVESDDILNCRLFVGQELFDAIDLRKGVHRISSDAYHMSSIYYKYITNTYICSYSGTFQIATAGNSEGESVAMIREFAV